jgi:alanine-synthesizing transaminase
VFSRRTNWNLQPNRFSIALDAHRASGKPLLDLTASNPTAIGLTYDTEIILAALSRPEVLAYEPASKGILPAREAVARYYAERGTALSPEQIILTVSTSEAYSYCFRLLCEPGDEVLVAVPSYPLFEFLADIQDVRLVPYELIYDHGWQIDFHSLERAITPRTRAVLLVHPNNPTGSYVSPSELRQLNVVAARHELALISDEVFLDYPLSQAPLTFAENSAALTFTLSGLSKISGLPQMKLAWIVTTGPEKLQQEALARLDVIADTYLSPSAPVQWSAETMLQSRSNIQGQLMARIRANLGFMDSELARHPHCTRLTFEGGWYATLRVPIIRTDEELAIALLESKSVLVHPGHFFDYPGDGYLILSLITPEADFREGLLRLLSFLQQQ